MAGVLPALNVPRVDPKTGQIDGRAMAQFCQNVALRIAALEAALLVTPGLTLQSQLQGLLKQADGLVYKQAGQLLTCQALPDGGIKIDAGATSPGGPRISAPLLAGLSGQPDGLVVKTDGGPLDTRVLQVSSGTALTIDNPDGAAGDPTFHGP